MTKEKIKLTRKEYNNLKKDLTKLYKETRPKIIEQLKIAYDFGDLRENSEFDSAKMEQHICDQKIKKLENILKYAIIIETDETKQINIGSTVIIEYLDNLEQDHFQIVGTSEVGIDRNCISCESPMGKALCDSKLNDIVEIKSPNGTYKVKVISIS